MISSLKIVILNYDINYRILLLFFHNRKGRKTENETLRLTGSTFLGKIQFVISNIKRYNPKDDAVNKTIIIHKWR